VNLTYTNLPVWTKINSRLFTYGTSFSKQKGLSDLKRDELTEE
jgi:hypothetical protein